MKKTEFNQFNQCWKMRKNKQAGQAVLIAVILSVTIATFILFGVAIPVADQVRNSTDYISSRQVLINSETVSEEVLYRLNKNKNIQNILGFSVLGNTSASINDIDPVTKQIISSSDNGMFTRKTITALLSSNRTVSFNFGAWLGGGGLRMSGTSVVNGNVFSLGGKSLSNGATINGNYSTASSSVNAPISDLDINNWKSQASTGSVINGNVKIKNTSTTTSGSLKIIGNLEIDTSGVMTLGGPLYVTGNLDLNNSAVMQLSPSYGSKSETVVVDGVISVRNSAYLGGSGNSLSNIILATQNTSGCSNLNCTNISPAAVELENTATVGAVVLAPNGAVYLSNSASTKGIFANYLYMENSASVTFDQSLINMSFNSSTSTIWSLNNLREI